MTTKQQLTTKQVFVEGIQRLPDDATLDDILERIHIILKIEIGREAGRKGDKITVEELREEAKGWASK